MGSGYGLGDPRPRDPGARWTLGNSHVGFVFDRPLAAASAIACTMSHEQYEDLTAEERTAQLKRLQDEHERHPGTVAHRRWEELRRMHETWFRNAQELRRLLLAAKNDEKLKLELIQNVREPVVRKEFMAALDQRLFNLISASIALVDYTRVVVKNYQGSTFARDFNRRNDELAKAPRTVFLRRFRNYLVHVGSAPFEMHAKFGTGEDDTIEFDLSLSSEALLRQFDEWTAPARTYIQSCGTSVPLLETITAYLDAMDGLYKWTSEQFEVLHSSEIDGANDLTRRINLTMTGGAHEGRDMEKFWEHVAENGRRAKRGEPQLDFQTGEPLPDKSEPGDE